MDWKLKSVAKKSTLSGNDFKSGENVISFIYKADKGEWLRADLSVEEESQFPEKEQAIARWENQVPDGEEKQDISHIDSTESLFSSFYDNPEIQKRYEEDVDTLKMLLALHLERKKILKSIPASNEENQREVIHKATKQTFSVPVRDLTPQGIEKFMELSDGFID
tara:strand:+ start:403 stop:897 length:495 start_codon:yes stop_codon:yes gene_type:complete